MENLKKQPLMVYIEERIKGSEQIRKSDYFSYKNSVILKLDELNNSHLKSKNYIATFNEFYSDKENFTKYSKVIYLTSLILNEEQKKNSISKCIKLANKTLQDNIKEIKSAIRVTEQLNSKLDSLAIIKVPKII